MMQKIIRFCLENRLIGAWGVMVAPFDWQLGPLLRDPVPVDAIPDIGENQQIVFTRWPGRSPRDVEDQISYPLTVSLLGIPGVKTIRSFSYFGYSSIYIIFSVLLPCSALRPMMACSWQPTSNNASNDILQPRVRTFERRC